MTIVKDKKNMEKCLCPKCPSYNHCANLKKEALFCSEEVGKSKCIQKKNGCICDQCPVYKENHLKTGYYCVYGSSNVADAKVTTL